MALYPLGTEDGLRILASCARPGVTTPSDSQAAVARSLDATGYADTLGRPRRHGHRILLHGVRPPVRAARARRSVDADDGRNARIDHRSIPRTDLLDRCLAFGCPVHDLGPPYTLGARRRQCLCSFRARGHVRICRIVVTRPHRRDTRLAPQSWRRHPSVVLHSACPDVRRRLSLADIARIARRPRPSRFDGYFNRAHGFHSDGVTGKHPTPAKTPVHPWRRLLNPQGLTAGFIALRSLDRLYGDLNRGQSLHKQRVEVRLSRPFRS